MNRAISRLGTAYLVHRLSMALMCLVAVAIIVASAGCAVQPKISTIEDQVAVGYATVDGVANSVTLYLEAGLLSVENAETYHGQLVDIKDTLDAGSVAIGIDKPQTALEALQVANKLLLELQIKLQEQVNRQSNPGGAP